MHDYCNMSMRRLYKWIQVLLIFFQDRDTNIGLASKTWITYGHGITAVCYLLIWMWINTSIKTVPGWKCCQVHTICMITGAIQSIDRSAITISNKTYDPLWIVINATILSITLSINDYKWFSPNWIQYIDYDWSQIR